MTDADTGARDVVGDRADAAGAGEVANDRPVSDASDGPGRVSYRALAITSGKYHTCVLLDDHNVKCWGQNILGQLGLGDKRHRGWLPEDMGDNLPVVDLGVGRRARAIAAGGYNTCAILEDGALKCWGYWMGNSNLGDEPGEMGDNLPTIDLGPGRSAKLVAFAYRGCVLLDDDTLKCWGQLATTLMPVELPSGPKVIDLSEGRGMGALFDDGTIRQIDLYGGPTTLVDLGGARATFIAGDEFRGKAVIDTGEILEWAPGTSPLGTRWPNVFGPVLAMSLGILCGMTDGVVRCEPYQSGKPTTLDLPLPAIALSRAAASHGCAILQDRSVRCWGSKGSQRQNQSLPEGAGWPAVDLGTRLEPGP